MSEPAYNLDPSLPKPGDLLAGKYRIERVLGQGGMGIVYAANHELLGVKVAIKLLLTDISSSQEAVTRFLNEARNAMKIQSENVAKVSDAGHLDGGRPYMVMEYLEGDDLSKLLEKHGVLTIQEAVDYTVQALEALAQAHKEGIVHRDLKPANLFLVARRDKTLQVKVLDFGISKATNPLSQGSGAMTSTKALLGSPYYMSPEQLRSSKSVDARADIWSMGIILFELMGGQPPFLGDNFGELFASILESDPPAIRSKRPDVPPQLEQVIMRCLQRRPEHRYSNVGELAAALSPFATPRGQRVVQRILDVMPIDGRPPSMAPQPPYPAQSGATYAMHPPMPGASTGSGVFSAPGVAPHGVQTNSSWTGAQMQPPPGLSAGAKAAIVLACFAVPLFIGLGLFLRSRLWVSHAAASQSSATIDTNTVPPPLPTTTAVPSAATTVAATDTASAAAPTKAPDPSATPHSNSGTSSSSSTHHTTSTTTGATGATATGGGHTTTPAQPTTHTPAPSATAFNPFGGGAH
ncbi:MAG: serine/threonine-protein kinase [Polyangiaceae bacterium]